MKLFLACLAILMMLTIATIDTPAQVGDKWVKLAPFPEAGEELYGITAGGNLYVFGGRAPGWKPRALVYEYDPASDKWTKKKPMALPSHHVALAELNGKIYAFGGFVPPQAGPPAWIPIDNTWEYDPAADSWKALAPMPTKRGSPVAAVVGGKIFVIGGAATHPGSSEPAVHPARPHRSVSTAEEYDPATNSWRARSPMPTARNRRQGARSPGVCMAGASTWRGERPRPPNSWQHSGRWKLMSLRTTGGFRCLRCLSRANGWRATSSATGFTSSAVTCNLRGSPICISTRTRTMPSSLPSADAAEKEA